MSSKTFAFINVNVVPMDEERVLFNQTVIVQNSSIIEIGDVAHIPIPSGAIRIDAAGQYMIPALSDMHVHLEGEAWNIMFPPDAQFSFDDNDYKKMLLPYIANGITTVQVMSALPDHLPLRQRISQGEVLGPRLILGRMIDGPDQAWPPPISTWVATPDEARQAVLDAKQAGYDGMKVYSFLSPDCYDAILATAHEIAMPVSGHIPDALSVEHILTAGQNLIAHAEEVMKGAGGNYDPERIDYYAGIIAESDTWITPTLITSRNILALFSDLDGEMSRSEIRYLHPMALGIWSYLIENMYLKIPPEGQDAIRNGFELFQRPLTKVLHDRGVKLMAGTDALIPTNIPGFSLHDELAELVAVGLTPYDALKASTTHPMEYLSELDEAGTVEVGKRADLVLLDANPLDDIANTRRVDGVLYMENWLSKADIQSRLEEFN